MELKGVSALISGGASGLGEATARALHAAGAAVTIIDLDVSRGRELVKEFGSGHRFVKGDVSNPNDVEAAVALAAELAPLRVAVSCAGIGWVERTVNRKRIPHDPHGFQKVINVNLVGTFNVLRLAAAEMSRYPLTESGERGVIVNTASVAAYDGQIGQLAYAASKAGIVGMTLPAARDLSKSGIRVATIAPGLFDTPLLASLPEKARVSLAASVPFPERLGEPAEYAEMVKFIVGSPYLNGEVIRFDGALRMAPK